MKHYLKKEVGKDNFIEVWQIDEDWHPYPWRFSIIVKEKKCNFIGVRNYCQNRKHALLRAHTKLKYFYGKTMENLQELIEKRDQVRSDLIGLEKAISKHPQTIKKAFRHNPEWDCYKFEKLISKISFIRWNTFNNICSFVVDEKIYNFYKSIGTVTTEDINEEIFTITPEFHFDLWNENDPVDFLEKQGITDDIQIICCLLGS